MLPVPKLFFGYARDLTALYPFGVGGAGIVFPERSTPERIFELIAEHRPTILVNVPTMMAQMIDSVRHGRCQAPDMSCLRMCTSAGEALPRELHDRWLDTFGVEVLDGIGSCELYHIYISNRPGRARAGVDRRARAGLRGRARRDRRAARHRRHGRALLLGRRREDGAHVRRRHRPHRRPVRARRRRLLLVPGPRRRPDQGRRDLGRAGRDRALPRRPSGRRRVRGRRRRAERVDDSARVRRRHGSRSRSRRSRTSSANGSRRTSTRGRSCSSTICRRRRRASSTGRRSPREPRGRRDGWCEGDRQGGRRAVRRR